MGNLIGITSGNGTVQEHFQYFMGSHALGTFLQETKPHPVPMSLMYVTH